MDLPWLEKHRPTTLDEIVGNDDAINQLKIISQSGNTTNLLFSGPAGTGKTSCIACLAKSLLGENFKKAVLELNASDERGIDTIRTKVKTFAQTSMTLPPGRHKIIILDEADSITPAAQNALRRTMEVFFVN